MIGVGKQSVQTEILVATMKSFDGSDKPTSKQANKKLENV